MKREHLRFLLVIAVVVAAGLGGLLVWLLQNPPAPKVVPAPVVAAPAPPPPADPYADRQADAITRECRDERHCGAQGRAAAQEARAAD